MGMKARSTASAGELESSIVEPTGPRPFVTSAVRDLGLALDRRGLLPLAEAERRYIRRVLEHVGGRLTGEGGAAEILDLKPSTLHFRLKKLGLRNDLDRARHRDRGAGR